MLFAVPRLYEPLLDAWEVRYPGTQRSVERLVDMGLVVSQPALVFDTRTGAPADSPGKPVPRYRTTAAGHRLRVLAEQDHRVLRDTFPRVTDVQLPKVVRLLSALDLEQPHARYGLSAPHASGVAGLPARTGRWWVRHLLEGGFIVELEARIADTRVLVPAHWRVTRKLCREVSAAISRTGAPASLAVEFRLSRSRFLDDIEPARIGVSGATDYDHDIETQRVLAALMGSARSAPDGVFSVEPRITLPVDRSTTPWRFDSRGRDFVFYQPDAEMRERDERTGRVRRAVVEYERAQSRRDAWSHIERFLGWLYERTLPFEPAVLRFVVDSEPRVRSYVALIEAFADQMLDHPDRLPGNEVVLAVSSLERVLSAADPLDPRVWFRITLPDGADTADKNPVLHNDGSPYDEYFGRA